MDLFDRLYREAGPLGSVNYKDEYFMFPKLEGEIAARMSFNGKEVLTWSLNNYLGLANHPEVRKADAEATKKYGLGYPMGARMMSGNTEEHKALEHELAAFIKKPEVMLLNYGYQGVLSLIDSLVTRKDVIVYDAESHACIVDGVRLHMGKRFVFPHNDIENLEKQLVRATRITEETGGGILVITEGVFGMSGKLGKLKEIAALKDKYNFRLLVDDAHGFGTMGATGAGTGEHLGVMDDIDIYFSTFAKSMASIGAFVSAEEAIIKFLRFNIRSQIYAKSLPISIVMGARKRLELLKKEPALKENLWRVVNAIQDGFKANGFEIGDTQSPVTPVYLNGTPLEAAGLMMDLRENYNIFCSGVIYPVVPKGTIILRIIPTAMHTLADVEETITAFKAIKHKLISKKYQNEGLAAAME